MTSVNGNSVHEESGIPLGTSTPQKPKASSFFEKNNQKMDFCEEKHRLSELNDRFAGYIDRVWALETENIRLIQEVSSLKSSNTSRNGEIMNVKSFVERETSDLRKLLDETDIQKAKVEIDLKRIWDENETLKSKLKEVQVENNRLSKVLETANENLELMTLDRVATENKNKSLKEEVHFLEKIYQEFSPKKSFREIDQELSNKYETKLQNSLKDLREKFEKQCNACRLELTQAFKTRLEQLEQAKIAAEKVIVVADQNWKNTVDKLNSKLDQIEIQMKHKDNLLKDLEKKLEEEMRQHCSDNEKSTSDIMSLNKNFQVLNENYAKLLDQKLALDNELVAYEQLLHGEETRFNLTPGGKRRLIEKDPTPKKAQIAKRRKTSIHTADFTLPPIFENPEIQISCPKSSGMVVLRNLGNNPVNLGNWKIIQNDEDHGSVSFQFDKNFILEKGARTTILSSNLKTSHTPKKLCKELFLNGANWLNSEHSMFVLSNNFGNKVSTFSSSLQEDQDFKDAKDTSSCSLM
ncbi:LMNB1 family protein [Megaselia abdita]